MTIYKGISSLASHLIKYKNNRIVPTHAMVNKLYASGYVKPAATLLGKLVVDGNHDLGPHLLSNMVISYAKSGSPDYALKLFKRFHIKDVYACNSILSAYSKKKEAQSASTFFELTMPESGIKPTAFTYVTYVKCLHDDKQWGLAREKILEMMRLGFKPDEFCYDVHYTGLCKSDKMIEAFKQFRNGEIKTSRLFNVFVKEFGINEEFNNMWAVVAHMWKTGLVPNEITYVRVVSSYFKFVKKDEAFKTIMNMKDEAFKTIMKVIVEGLASSNLFNTSLRSCLTMGWHAEVRKIAKLMDVGSLLIQPDLRVLFLASVDPNEDVSDVGI